MVKLDDDDNILITRGDTTTGKVNRLAFDYPIENLETEEIEQYEFQPDDKITFVAMYKKGYTKREILRKEYTLRDIGYIRPTKVVELPLTAEDTKKFPLKNKAQTYWYDLILNNTTTIEGFDEDGGKKIIVYPEAGEK